MNQQNDMQAPGYGDMEPGNDPQPFQTPYVPSVKRDRQKGGIFFAFFVMFFSFTVFILILSMVFLAGGLLSTGNTPFLPYFYLLLPIPGSSGFIVINGAVYAQTVPLILVVIFHSVQLAAVAAVVFILYGIFFALMVWVGIRSGSRSWLKNPISFYSSVIPAAYGLVFVSTLFELATSIPIGGTFINSGLKTTPYLVFTQLIYAPFVEELGFRIIPLGLLSVLLFAYRKNITSGKDALYAFFMPGLFRKKTGAKIGWLEWTFILLTSATFGYAHAAFGAWGWGKIITAALAGFFLALGFMEFGFFVDIPMHWFFNGTTTMLLLPVGVGTIAAVYVYILLIFVMGVVSLIYFVLYFTGYFKPPQRFFTGAPPGP